VVVGVELVEGVGHLLWCLVVVVGFSRLLSSGFVVGLSGKDGDSWGCGTRIAGRELRS
jgi:hypothetical protein